MVQLGKKERKFFKTFDKVKKHLNVDIFKMKCYGFMSESRVPSFIEVFEALVSRHNEPFCSATNDFFHSSVHPKHWIFLFWGNLKQLKEPAVLSALSTN